MTVEEFKEQVRTLDFDEVLNQVLLSEDAAHVEALHTQYIKTRLSEKFHVDIESIRLIVVGSAKLGFSIVEKKRKDLPKLPRYRPFSADSDVDIAVICQPIFKYIWNELSEHSFRAPYYPRQSDRLGDYLVCGWLRPDHFPRNVRLRACDDWWRLFSSLSSQQYLGRRKIRAALFFSIEQLSLYQSKSLRECVNIETAGE
ncbi:MAG: hypothetical protein ABIN80_09990 [Dyadobacter sp.]|uniref:hypothetical protein n=1 Tax=Dyadobacter sp. TaxID=1914288 RepID=UPI003265D378